jgi:hypothetical protein
MHQVGQVFSGEFPLEGLSDFLIVFLKVENPFGQVSKGKKVIGREYFALEDGEIDFDLVQPAGMDGKMDNNDLWPLTLKSIDGGQSSMRGTIVENPENPSGGAVRFTCHDVLNQAGEGYDPGFALAPTEQFCSLYIPGRQVAQRPLSRVFKFYLLSFSLSCSKARRSSMSRLNAGLFIGGDHKVVRPQGKPIPHPLIEVQNPAGLLLKLRVPGKDPAPVVSRLDGILSQPSPDGRPAHVSHNAPLNSFPRNLAGAPSRQRNPALRGQLTGQSLYPDDEVWGENRTAAQVWIDLPAPGAVHRKTASSTCSLFAGAVPASARWHRFPYPEKPLESPWPGSPNNKVTYIFAQSFPAHRAQPTTTQLGMDSSLALNPPHRRIYAKGNICMRKYHYNTSSYL